MAKRIPPTRFPDAAAVQYYRRLRALIKEMHKVTMMLFDKRMKDAIKQYKSELKADSYSEDDALDVVRQALELMRSLTLGVFPSDVIQRLAESFIGDVDRLSKANIEGQMRVKGIDPITELWLDSFKRSVIAENVTLIKDIQSEYAKSVEVIINHGTRTGKSLKDIQQDIQYRLDVTERRARLIARDQTGKVFGQITERRHRDMGVRKFKWSTSKDERVRESHKKLDGKIFDYDNPPAVGLPGDDFQCRCLAIPVFEDEEDEENEI